ncbi:MAG: hypothetical protein IKF72_07550 [Kiritimatiellae bacterium]|nr:hypothetical protein [Kiritimatiellia bacterium]
MNIKCPHCGTEYEVEKIDMYHYTKCGVCSKGFVIGAETSMQDSAKNHSSSDSRQRAPANRNTMKKMSMISDVALALGVLLVLVVSAAAVGGFCLLVGNTYNHLDPTTVIVEGVKISTPKNVGSGFEKAGDGLYTVTMYDSSSKVIWPDTIDIMSRKEKWPMRSMDDYVSDFIAYVKKEGKRAQVISVDENYAYIEHETSTQRCYKKILRDVKNERFVLVSAYYNKESTNEDSMRKCVQGAKLAL